MSVAGGSLQQQPTVCQPTTAPTATTTTAATEAKPTTTTAAREVAHQSWRPAVTLSPRGGSVPCSTHPQRPPGHHPATR